MMDMKKKNTFYANKTVRSMGKRRHQVRQMDAVQEVKGSTLKELQRQVEMMGIFFTLPREGEPHSVAPNAWDSI